MITGQARAFQCRFFSSKLETEGEDEIFNALLAIRRRAAMDVLQLQSLVGRALRAHVAGSHIGSLKRVGLPSAPYQARLFSSDTGISLRKMSAPE